MKGDTTMRVMVIVKANKESEAGQLPDTEILTKMGKYNEQLVKAGIMLAGDGLQASAVLRRKADRDRRAVRGNERTDCRVLDVAGAVDRGGGGVAEAGSL